MITLENVCIRAGKFRLNRLSLHVPSGCYAVLMGQTGHGKTTILEAICGLKRISSGKVLLDGQEITNWSPGDREIGYVPQDLALFPTHSVRENLAFALKLRNVDSKTISARTTELSETLGVTHLLDRSVRALSGGESQRVALGRAISFRPSVLLLDEPLSALDESTRTEMHELLKRIQQTTRVTILHVTHSQQEADALADKQYELADGSIQELKE